MEILTRLEKWLKKLTPIIVFAIMIIASAQSLESNEFLDEAESFVTTVNNIEELNTEFGKKSSTESFIEPEDTATGLDLSLLPEYSGDAYIYVNGNVPFFTIDEITTDMFEQYSELDSLGRCGVAFANICTETLPTKERSSISDIYPSGWIQAKYEGLIDQDWLYNRCHLIAHSLAGEDANEKNLITGTRYMNIEGMWQIEETVLNYVKENPSNHVLYRVTPIYENDNLVASGVLMEAYSIEDNGKGVCINVYCYNVAPGIVIDYATGDSWAAE